MTTNAIDRKKVILASDSRWSYVINGSLVFVDDTGFDKIAVRREGAMICAGDGQLIDQWKKWFFVPILDVVNLPPTDRTNNAGIPSTIDITLMDDKGQILFSNGWYITLDDHALFAGSGASPAYDCFSVNMCAKTSVESARKVDDQTGGGVMYAELARGHHNLTNPPKTLQDANQALLDKGMVMNMTTKKVVTMKDYVASQGVSAGSMNAGDFNLSAPTGQPLRTWTNADRNRLRSAIVTMVEQHQESEDVEAI